MHTEEIENKAKALRRDGYVLLSDQYSPSAIGEARAQVIANFALLKNTRPNPVSGHLAGFHRYPAFEPLHDTLVGNQELLGVVKCAAGDAEIRSIGLSDITVNRSQEWHVDLLRGQYQPYLDPDICWGPQSGGVYKALLYLQQGSSLRVIPGAHRRAIPLDNDRNSEPADPSESVSIAVGPGDIVLMDIRLPHRGSTEAEMRDDSGRVSPKILVSTVLGGARLPLTRAMEAGNRERLRDWDNRHERHGVDPSRLAPEAH